MIESHDARFSYFESPNKIAILVEAFEKNKWIHAEKLFNHDHYSQYLQVVFHVHCLFPCCIFCVGVLPYLIRPCPNRLGLETVFSLWCLSIASGIGERF
jgi:hypothetical protein